MLSDWLDCILNDEPIKEGEPMKWHFRAADETGYSWYLGSVLAPDMASAMREAHKMWPDEGAFVNWVDCREDFGNGAPG